MLEVLEKYPILLWSELNTCTKISDTTKSQKGVTQFLTDILSKVGYISSTFTLLNIYIENKIALNTGQGDQIE